jgi:HlyD family secretion protein
MIKTLLVLTVLAAVPLSAAVWYLDRTDAQLPSLRTVAVDHGDLQFTIDASGTVQAEEVVDVGAQVAGKIQSLGVDPRDPKRSIDYGSPVSVGTVLAHIDDSLYQSDVEQAQAEVASAQALVESTAAGVLEAEANVERANKDILQLRAKLFQAERDWQRTQGLWKSSPGAISEYDYDLARSAYESADAAVGVGVAAIAQAGALQANSKAAVSKSRADLSIAQANLRRAQTNLGYCTIKSPVSGVIIDRRINVGQTVVSSFNSPSLFLIAKDLKRLVVWASVNEADIGHIKSGQAVTFRVDGAPKTFRGVVAPDQPRLNASMTQNVVTYTVVVNTDNSDGLLIPYRTADLKFEVAQHPNVLIVPNTALRWKPSPERLAASGLPAEPVEHGRAAAKLQEIEPDGTTSGEGTVWLVDGERIRSVKVRTGLSDGTRTEVASNELQAGTALAIGEEFIATDEATTDPFSPKVFGGGGRRPQQ